MDPNGGPATRGSQEPSGHPWHKGVALCFMLHLWGPFLTSLLPGSNTTFTALLGQMFILSGVPSNPGELMAMPGSDQAFPDPNSKRGIIA